MVGLLTPAFGEERVKPLPALGGERAGAELLIFAQKAAYLGWPPVVQPKRFTPFPAQFWVKINTSDLMCQGDRIHASFEAVEYAPLEWVDWFNNHRLVERIGSIAPAEAEANFYAALETEPMAA